MWLLIYIPEKMAIFDFATTQMTTFCTGKYWKHELVFRTSTNTANTRIIDTLLTLKQQLINHQVISNNRVDDAPMRFQQFMDQENLHIIYR